MSRCRAADLALVGFALVVQVPFAIAMRNHDAGRHLEWFGIVLISAGPLLLWWRRRFPVAVLLAVFGTTLAYDLTQQPRGPIWVALSIAFFQWIGEHDRAERAVAGEFDLESDGSDGSGGEVSGAPLPAPSEMGGAIAPTSVVE